MRFSLSVHAASEASVMLLSYGTATAGRKQSSPDSMLSSSTVLRVNSTDHSNVLLINVSVLQGHTVEEIIQGWNAELDSRAQAFAKHAQALQEWDRAILTRRHALLAVEEGVIKVLIRGTSCAARGQAARGQGPSFSAVSSPQQQSRTCSNMDITLSTQNWQ